MNLKLLGSSLIVAGTALGAGMLAIPMVLSQFGLMWSSILMLIIWAGTTYAGMLLLECAIKLDGCISMNSIAKNTIGKGGQLITNILLYAVLVCLLMAYIVGAADILKKMLLSIDVDITIEQSQILFTLFSGAVVASGTAIVDKVNRLLFGLVLVVLVITLFSLVPSATLDNILEVSNYSKLDLFKASSVVFTSFNFMVVVPPLVAYNKEATIKQLRNMVLLGASIPLACNLSWLIIASGNIDSSELSLIHNVSELVSLLGEKYNVILSIFTGLALLTSFLGIAMSLFNQNHDLISKNRFITFIVTFILPLIGALIAADKFIMFINYAGVILAVLAILIPVAMVIRVRKKIPNNKFQIAGGKGALILSCLFGCTLLASQIV